MAETREKIVQGSKVAVLITMSGLPDGVNFTDDTVGVILYFYTYNKRRQAEVTVNKSDLHVSEDSTCIFWASLDTTTLPEGILMCEGEITYPFTSIDGNVTDRPYFDCGMEIVTNK